jgi:hypothetical protein
MVEKTHTLELGANELARMNKLITDAAALTQNTQLQPE